MAAPGAGNGSSNRNRGSSEENNLILPFIKIKYTNEASKQRDEQSNQLMENKKIQQFNEYVKHIEFDILQNKILKRVIYGIGTSYQSGNIYHILSKKIEEEREDEITLLFHIDSHLKKENDRDKRKGELNKIETLSEIPFQEYATNIFKSRNLVVIFLPYYVKSNYFIEHENYDKGKIVKQKTIAKLIETCKPAKNNLFYAMLNFVKNNHFDEFYVFNDAHSNYKNISLNMFWENMCELFYILDKANADKKYIITSFKNFKGDKHVYKCVDRCINKYVYTFTKNLLFETDIDIIINTKNITEQALGAGAGTSIEPRGGKRRTITRKQKKRSRKNRK